MDKNEEKKRAEQKEEQLKNMIKEIGDNFEVQPELIAEAVAFGSQFYQYSLKNTMLIYQQNKYSQYVQSFQKWKEMGVSVKRGEHGMSIFVPVQTTYLKVGEDEFVQLRYATKEQKEALKKGELESVSRTHFRIGTVFDISQTTFPKERYPELFQMGYANEQYSTLVKGLVKFCEQEMDCPVRIEDVKSIGLRGFYTPSTHEITLNNLLEDSERLSTLSHEMGHAMVHQDPIARMKSEAMREFEADALSIMLQSHFNVELTESRKRHLAHHYQELKGKEPETKINDCLNDVFQVYKSNIDSIDQHINACIEKEKEMNIDVEKEVQMDPLHEMLEKTAQQRKTNTISQDRER